MVQVPDDRTIFDGWMVIVVPTSINDLLISIGAVCKLLLKSQKLVVVAANIYSSVDVVFPIGHAGCDEGMLYMRLLLL